MTKIDIEESSGNIFADLGIPDPEETLIQADLALALARHVQQAGWTQKEAAKVLGIAQPDVSNIVRGRLAGFSIERLIRLLGLLGQTVQVTVIDQSHASQPFAERKPTRAAESATPKRRRTGNPSDSSAPKKSVPKREKPALQR